MILINIDGIDGSGKSTIVEKIFNLFCLMGIRTKVVHFPRYKTQIGSWIHKVLIGEKSCNGVPLQVLYTADRIDFCLNEIEELNSYEVVLIDRYYTSGYVYGMKEGLSVPSIQKMHEGIIKPKKHFILKVPIEQVIGRLKTRDCVERYDNKETLEEVYNLYIGLKSILPKDETIEYIDNSNGYQEQAFTKIVHDILEILRESELYGINKGNSSGVS